MRKKARKMVVITPAFIAIYIASFGFLSAMEDDLPPITIREDTAKEEELPPITIREDTAKDLEDSRICPFPEGCDAKVPRPLLIEDRVLNPIPKIVQRETLSPSAKRAIIEDRVIDPIPDLRQEMGLEKDFNDDIDDLSQDQDQESGQDSKTRVRNENINIVQTPAAGVNNLDRVRDVDFDDRVDTGKGVLPEAGSQSIGSLGVTSLIFGIFSFIKSRARLKSKKK